MTTFRDYMRLAKISIDDKTSRGRMMEILRIMNAHEVNKGLTPKKAVEVLQDLGPTYVKIGQLASNRSDILPAEYCEAFASLRSRSKPMPFDEVEGVLAEAYGADYSHVFASVDAEPLGSASIAQVHKATLADGSTVAVKVRRPGIVETMSQDIMLLRHLMATGAVVPGPHQDALLTLEGFVDEMERTTADELDFTVELNNLVRFGSAVKGKAGISSPKPYPEISSDSVLVMEYVEGCAIDDLTALAAQGISHDRVGALAKRACQNYISQVLDEGFFHADPHPGNLIVRDGELVWIDLGMTGSLTSAERMLVGECMIAVATDNVYKLKDSLLGLAYANPDADHARILDALTKMLAKYRKAALGDIDVGAVFSEMVEIMRSEKVAVIPSVTMLGRGLVTLEGLVSDIAPDLDVMGVISEQVLASQLRPVSVKQHIEDAFTTSASSVEALVKLPTQLSNAIDMVERGQVKVKSDVDVAPRTLSVAFSSVDRLAMAILAAGLFLGSSLLCLTGLQPQVAGVPMLGFGGYIGAFVLGVYTLVRILKSRKETRDGIS